MCDWQELRGNWNSSFAGTAAECFNVEAQHAADRERHQDLRARAGCLCKAEEPQHETTVHVRCGVPPRSFLSQPAPARPVPLLIISLAPLPGSVDHRHWLHLHRRAVEVVFVFTMISWNPPPRLLLLQFEACDRSKSVKRGRPSTVPRRCDPAFVHHDVHGSTRVRHPKPLSRTTRSGRGPSRGPPTGKKIPTNQRIQARRGFIQEQDLRG